MNRLFILISLATFLFCSFITEHNNNPIPELEKLTLENSSIFRIRLNYEYEDEIFSDNPSSEQYMCSFDSYNATFNNCIIDIHGNGTFYAKRKNFDIKLATGDSIDINTIKTKRFKLLSLSSDKGYINNLLGYTLSKKLDLFYSEFKLIELYINENSHGMYLLMEDVESSIRRSFPEVEFIIRRRNNSDIDLKYYKSKNSEKAISASDYMQGYNNLYYYSDLYNKEELLNLLTNNYDFKKYCTWLSLNTLLKNGDYTDELYIHALPIKNSNSLTVPYFNFSVWDFDDLFKEPHMGNSIPNSLIYCSENKLDRQIAFDSVLYNYFSSTLNSLLIKSLTTQTIDTVFDDLTTKLKIYLSDEKFLKINNNLEVNNNSKWIDYQEYYDKLKLDIIDRRKHLLKILNS